VPHMRSTNYRRSHGLKAIPVNLGIMRDIGGLAETGTTGNIKLWEEVLGIPEPAFHALKSLINQQQEDCPVQVFTGLGAADIMATHGLARSKYFNDPRFRPLAVTSMTTTTSVEGQGSAVSLASRHSKASSKE
jgi:hypothetical protein